MPGKLSNSWQNGFSRVTTRKGKGANSRVFTGDLMVGLGGLEPPTSPLSGARSSHLSYRPQHRSGTDHNHLIVRWFSLFRNCAEIFVWYKGDRFPIESTSPTSAHPHEQDIAGLGARSSSRRSTWIVPRSHRRSCRTRVCVEAASASCRRIVSCCRSWSCLLWFLLAFDPEAEIYFEWKSQGFAHEDSQGFAPH